MTTLLDVSDLTKAFQGVRAVDGASLSVRAGSITGLIGPNGSGKSTTIDCISGFQRPDAGAISFAGHDIDHLSPQRIAQLGLTRTFQDVRVYDGYSLLDNLLVPTKPFISAAWHDCLLASGVYRRARKAAETRARELIDMVGLTRLIDAPATVLSYGQKKLLAFAGAMMCEPQLIVLDEPVAGVNPTRINEVAEILRRANRAGVSFLVVEHNVDFITSICDHVIVLDCGRKLTEGAPRVVHEDPKVLEAYLGVAPDQREALA